MRSIAISAILLASLLVGCGGGPAPGSPDSSADPQLVSSPNGEPLAYVAEASRCDTLVGGWFTAVDTNRDGLISLPELEADAQRWFLRADADSDGFITVTELTAIRRPMEPPPKQRMARRGQIMFDSSDLSTRRDTDPVMAADVNLDFRVSRDELMALVGRRYTAMTRRGPYDKAAVTQFECDRRKFARPGLF